MSEEAFVFQEKRNLQRYGHPSADEFRVKANGANRLEFQIIEDGSGELKEYLLDLDGEDRLYKLLHQRFAARRLQAELAEVMKTHEDPGLINCMPEHKAKEALLDFAKRWHRGYSR